MLFFRVTPPLHLMVGVLTAVKFSVHTAGPHELDSMSSTSAAVTFGMSIPPPPFSHFLTPPAYFFVPSILSCSFKDQVKKEMVQMYSGSIPSFYEEHSSKVISLCFCSSVAAQQCFVLDLVR